MLHIIIIVATVIVAILLIGVVLIQKSKGGGLSSQFAGANAVMGVRQTKSGIENLTWTLAGLIVLLSIISAFTMPKVSADTAIRTQQTSSTRSRLRSFLPPTTRAQNNHSATHRTKQTQLILSADQAAARG